MFVSLIIPWLSPQTSVRIGKNVFKVINLIEALWKKTTTDTVLLRVDL